MTVAQAQTDLRRRILRAFVGRGLLERFEAKEMLAYKHSGFSVDAGVCIEAHDRSALERLLRYCARQPFLDFTFSRVNADGSEQQFRVSGEPIFDSACSFTGYRGIGAEITARGTFVHRLVGLNGRLHSSDGLLWQAFIAILLVANYVINTPATAKFCT